MKRIIIWVFMMLHFSVYPIWALEGVGPAVLVSGQAGNNINPAISSFNVWLDVEPVFMTVWQNDSAGNQDIYAKWGYLWTDPWLSDKIIPVTVHSDSDICPKVDRDTWQDRYYCVWQSDRTGDWQIFVSKGDTLSWTEAIQISNSSNCRKPAIDCSFIPSGKDTAVYVAWQQDSAGYSNIYCRRFSIPDSSWGPVEAVSSDTFENSQPNIQAKSGGDFTIIWQKLSGDSSDLWQREKTAGLWQPPQRITFNGRSSNPCYFYYDFGSCLGWQSDSSGNSEIYFIDYNYSKFQITDNSSIDRNPANQLVHLVWEGNQAGNFDIFYTNFYLSEPCPAFLDSNPSNDINPALMIYFCPESEPGACLWQSDRNGKWDIYGVSGFFGPGGVAGKNDEQDIGKIFLSQNVPNPASGKTSLDYQIAQPGHVKLKIFNSLGQMVKILVDKRQMPGKYDIVWNGLNQSGNKVPSGIYFYRLEFGGKSTAKKMTYLR